MTKRTASKQHTINCSNGCLRSVRLTRKEAIKCFCVECLGFEADPKECICRKCPLYPFRGRTLLNKIGNIERK